MAPSDSKDPTQPDRSEMWETVRRLLKDHGRRHAKGYVIAFVCMAFAAATTSLAAYLMRDVINRVFIERDQSLIWILAGAIAAIYTVKGLATFGHMVILSRIGGRIVSDIQAQVYDRLLKQDLAFFVSRHSSDLVTRITQSANAARTLLNTIVTSAGRDLLSLVGLATVMVIMDPVMASFGLVVLPVAILALRRLSRLARDYTKTEFQGATEIVQTMQETAQGIRIVKAFGLEGIMRARLARAVNLVRKSGNRRSVVIAATSPMTETLAGFAVAIVVAYAGYRVIEGGQTPGEFAAFVTALLLAYEPAKRLARFRIEFAQAVVGVRMFYEIIDLPGAEDEPPGKPDLVVTKGAIAFEGIRFAYRPDAVVLDGIDLVAEAGTTTALVGASGGGKTTIVNLLQRFWPVEAGRITIDGQDIAEVSLASLRRHIAFVSQDVFLFDGTIRENIGFGRAGATEAEIEAAARAANAYDFISAMPKGFDTEIGESGSRLSGGQRQRIAIARAILKDAPIILLDEATASLDNESEREVQRALERLMQGRTTLVVAHRLQTVINADRILVIERGRVVESGPHAELMARRGRYFALAQAHELAA